MTIARSIARSIARPIARGVGEGVGTTDPILALFANGEQGAYYSRTRSGLFQDSNGANTTPAGIGDPVGRISDLSGNGYHTTPFGGSASKRPIVRSNDILFDDVDDVLIGSGAVDLDVDEWWWWLLGKASGSIFLAGVASAGRDESNLGNSTIFLLPDGAGSAVSDSFSPTLTEEYAAWLFRLRKSDKSMTAYRGGAEVASVTSAASNWFPDLMGMSLGGINGVSLNDLSFVEAGFINRALTTSEQAALNSELEARNPDFF